MYLQKQRANQQTMSDGNFNRALLPKNELSAGLKAGKAQMRAKAEQAFKEIIERHFPDATQMQKDAALESFKKRLR